MRDGRDRQTQTHTNWPRDVQTQLAKRHDERMCSEHSKAHKHTQSNTIYLGKRSFGTLICGNEGNQMTVTN